MRSIASTKIFSPYFFAIAYLVYLLFALLAFEIPSTKAYLPNINIYKPFIITLIFIAVFNLTCFFCEKTKNLKIKKNIILLLAVILAFVALIQVYSIFNALLILITGYSTLLIYTNIISKKTHGLILFPAVLSFIAFFMISYQGLPIFSPELRLSISSGIERAIFYPTALLASVFSVVFYRKKALYVVFLMVILSLLGGFKGDLFAILVASSIAGFLTFKLNKKHLIIIFLLVFIAISIEGAYIAKISYKTWKIPFYYYLFYRAGFTFSIFAKIVEISFPFGYSHFACFLTSKSFPAILAEMFGEKAMLTSTFLGAMMFDSGIIGVLISAILTGVYLSYMYKGKSVYAIAFYSIALAHVLALIELTPLIQDYVFLLLLLYLRLCLEEGSS